MTKTDSAAGQRLRAFKQELEREFDQRFPTSKRHHDRYRASLLDGTSHAMRWGSPFMPVVRRADGATVEDLDGNHIIDYWQGHFANLLGHNPSLVRDALAETLAEGRGLQTGMLHESEARLADTICRLTGSETARLTTAGTLGTLYAALLARSHTGREHVLKVSGGWHGSQPFGLKGVQMRDGTFEHLESEGLPRQTLDKVLLTRFNDVEDLRSRFAADGDRIACFVLEPMLGAGGGMCATVEYMREARRLTEHHGALLISDEIITGFRFCPGDLTSRFGIKADLLILGKVLGGGMPVAAVAGRREVLQLASRDSGRVKFEGGTYSAHELSLRAAQVILQHLEQHGGEIYARLGAAGERLRRGVASAAAAEGLPIEVLGDLPGGLGGSSLVFFHVVRDAAPTLTSADDLARYGHPRITERLLKSVLLLENLSTRSGIGAISSAHGEPELNETLESLQSGFNRLRASGVV